MTQWYCRLMGDELGPFTSAQLLEMARSHQLTPEDCIRKGSDGDWIGAYRVNGLFDEAGSAALLAPSTEPTAPQAEQPTAKAPAEEWFCICNHEKLGPMPFDELQSLASAGKLHPTDRVWTSLVPKHRMASEIPGLRLRAAAS